MATQAEDVQAVETEHLLQVYKRVPLVLTRGEGSYLFDTDGQPYLDFVSGLGVASLGHANPALAAAVAAGGSAMSGSVWGTTPRSRGTLACRPPGARTSRV